MTTATGRTDMRHFNRPERPPRSRIGLRAIAHAAAKNDARRAEIRERMAQRVREILDRATAEKRG